ncbi:MAG: right-handed parallel beta-helix repeat-containing protein [Planctomycetota bacterium]|jgi:hypothetical protein
MLRKKINFAIVLAALLLLVGVASATNYYVDPNGDDDANGLSWATAFETIQKGIDSSSNSDIVEVNEGIYYEAIDFNSVSCTLKSTDPNDWDVVESTIIDADGNSITLSGGGTTQGVTITGAASTGVRCFSYDETVVEKCIIEDCGTGVYICCESADVNNCIIKNNDSTGVSIAYTTLGTNIKNNIIFNNSSGIYVDLFDDEGDIIIRNNTIVSNTTYGIAEVSGQTSVSNCIIWDCNDDLYSCSATYSCIEDGDSGEGNISSDPCFANIYFFRDVTTAADTNTTIEVADASLYLVNDVIEYDNDRVARTVTAVDEVNDIVTFANDALGSNSESGIQIYNWDGATDVNEDFHLKYSNSPCVDVGDPNGNYTGETDIDGDNRVIDIAGKGDGVNDVDMGADEYVLYDKAFSVLDSSDANMAIFDNMGNLFLKGTLDESTSHTATAVDEFIVEDSNGSELAIIDANDGNMYIDGQIFESQGTLTPSGTNNFIIEDSNGITVAYIDDPNGDLYLKGKLYQWVW